VYHVRVICYHHCVSIDRCFTVLLAQFCDKPTETDVAHEITPKTRVRTFAQETRFLERRSIHRITLYIRSRKSRNARLDTLTRGLQRQERSPSPLAGERQGFLLCPSSACRNTERNYGRLRFCHGYSSGNRAFTARRAPRRNPWPRGDRVISRGIPRPDVPSFLVPQASAPSSSSYDGSFLLRQDSLDANRDLIARVCALAREDVNFVANIARRISEATRSERGRELARSSRFTRSEGRRESGNSCKNSCKNRRLAISGHSESRDVSFRHPRILFLSLGWTSAGEFGERARIIGWRGRSRK